MSMYYPTAPQTSYMYTPTTSTTSGIYGAMSSATASAGAAATPFSASPFNLYTGSSPYMPSTIPYVTGSTGSASPYTASPYTASPFNIYTASNPYIPSNIPYVTGSTGTMHASSSYVGGQSPFNMNSFPFNVPRPTTNTGSYNSTSNYNNTNINNNLILGLTQSLSGISSSLNTIQGLLLSQQQNNQYLYGGNYNNANNCACPNTGTGNSQALLNLLLKGGLGGIGGGNTSPNNNGLGSLLLPLLLQLLGNKGNGSNPILPGLPILPTPPSVNPGPGPGVWGDPHFTTKYGNFDFQGTEGLKTSDTPVYRLYDNGVTKINAEYAANANKSVSIISELSAKVGDNVVKYDASTKKLTVDGKEVKAGESVALPHTGIKVDGREVAGSVSVDDTGKVQLDVGDRILNFSSPNGTWSGHSYINLTTTNTQVGTQSTDAGDGKAFRQGGALGFVDGVTQDQFNQYTSGGKAALEKLFNDTFHVGGLDDFNGWKGFGDSTTDYQYGVNANETTGAE